MDVLKSVLGIPLKPADLLSSVLGSFDCRKPKNAGPSGRLTPLSSQLLGMLPLAAMILVSCRPCVWEATCNARVSAERGEEEVAASGCTVLTVSVGEQVFFGGNDDYIHPDSFYWVDPGDAENYGAIWVGQPDNVQQGINEHGLTYDANGLPRMDVNPHSERKPVLGGYTSYPIQILHECSTVEEVIFWVNTHQWHSYMHDQMHFADATGDAVIISAGPDGEVAFTRKALGDGFLVSTNFNVADPANGFGYPCWRFDRAQELLTSLVSERGHLTANRVADVLEAVHVEGGASWTISSLVADLTNRVVYLYYFHQFDRPVVLNVADELAQPRPAGPLSELFPYEVQREAARRYERIQAIAGRCRWAGITWAAIVMASLILLVARYGGRRRGLVYWVPAVTTLGPLALLVWLIVRRDRQLGSWRAALVEALGDLLPCVIAFVAILVIVIQVSVVQGTWPLQIALILGLPLACAWLIFHGSLLHVVVERGYWQFLFRRFPQVLVTVNLGMAGISVVAVPGVDKSLRVCSVLPLSAWTVFVWWLITALGALVGGLLLFLYESWAVSRGFRAWAVLAGSGEELRSPSCRQSWWWILLSYVAFLCGLAVGAILQQLLS